MQVLHAPHPMLKMVSQPVKEITPEIHRIFDQMLEVMYREDGGGLAAIQVGIPKRMVVIDVEEDRLPPGTKGPFFMVNPEIVWVSDNKVWHAEACVSVPGVSGEVLRPDRSRIRFTDREGKEHEIESGGYLGRCFQHELDHLDGILYVDHMSALKRQMLLKKSQRYLASLY